MQGIEKCPQLFIYWEMYKEKDTGKGKQTAIIIYWFQNSWKIDTMPYTWYKSAN